MIHVIAVRTGSWMLHRSIDNGASLTGIAKISRRDDGRFDYRERGRLCLADGKLIDAARRYIFAEEPDGFEVLFAEIPLRRFHPIPMREDGPNLVGSAEHFCAPDQYDSRYEFHADGKFVIRHVVRGPRKHYTMLTHYDGEPLIRR